VDDAALVLAANDAFYRAFRDRDYPKMVTLWAKKAPVACMHPGMDVIHGRENVLRSFRGILTHEGSPELVCTRVEVKILGETAFVTCLEGALGQKPALIATNVFVREDGIWRMVCHQAGALTQRERFERIEKDPDPEAGSGSGSGSGSKVWN
jgi:ketosteroid isomerase-like protein